MTEESSVNIVFEPIRGTSQAFALDSRADHTLYHGTRGVGKTAVQLMRFRSRVGIGYGAFWRGIVFDKEYKNLSDIIAQSKKLFYSFNDGAKFLAGPDSLKWVWPTGEELLFRHIKKNEDYENFHGHEYPSINYNELTKWATPFLYEKMMSCNRSSFIPEKDTPKDRKGNYLTPDGKPLPPIPLEVFATTNPHGAGHNWVKRKFISSTQPGKMLRRTSTVYDPRLKEDVEVTKTQVAIFGSYKENIYLPTSYIAELDAITDPNLRRAWFKGDWDVVAGGAFDDVWSTNLHIVPRFVIPAGWAINRGFDWGSTHPFAVVWFAESNGEEATLEDGRKWCPPAGTIVQFFEWYGGKEIGTNEGIKMSPVGIAEGIIEREIALMEVGWIQEQPEPGPADNQIWANTRVDQKSIASTMEEVGVKWLESDKSPGSRRNGMQLFRDRLEAGKKGEGPGYYVMNCCQATINTVPWLPRDEKKPDDVDTDAEDHIYDVIRYRCLSNAKKMATKVKMSLGY